MTVLLEDCPNGTVEEQILNSIFEILESKEQVKKSIKKMVIGTFSISSLDVQSPT